MTKSELNRRTVLAGAAAAIPAAALPALALAAPSITAAVPAAGDDRIVALYAEFLRAVHTPAPFRSKKHEATVLNTMRACEKEILALPTASARDLAIKVQVETGEGTFEVSDEFLEEQILPLLPDSAERGGRANRRVTADPIFGAIEKYRTAYAAWVQSYDRATDEWDERLAAAERRAVKVLARTKPTTQAGVLALVQYVAECETNGLEITMACIEKRGQGPTLGNALWETLAEVLPRLAKAA